MKIYGKLLLLIFISCSFVFASNNKDIAIILKTRGQAKVKKSNPGKWRIAKRGMHLNSGDIVKTTQNSLMAIIFTDDKSMLKIRDNSTVVIKGKRKKRSISKRLKLALGQIWVSVKKQKTHFFVETPSGIAAVKGTEFYSFVDKDGNTTIIGIEGIVSFRNKFGEILIRAGETGLASKLTAPSVKKTDKSQVPSWGKENEDTGNQLEFEFEDNEGNKKVLKINYEE